MTNDAAKHLCLELLHANTEEAVISILTREGFWKDSKCWRLYGDKEQNFAQGGNQQSRSDAALVEKLVNSVDARLMNECLLAGVDPTSAKAPTSIREAVNRFFEKNGGKNANGGALKDWPQSKRREQANFITVAATGSRKDPCLTIADQGEGQTPDRMPDTLLSLDKQNKLRVHFVQGKFNMGGTGVLRFCGTQSLQLIISRRNPGIAVNETGDAKDHWGFTVVRRERPTEEVGAVRNSVYKYLSPIDSDKSPNRGRVLRFTSDSLRAMPDGNYAYARDIEWGTVIKLYEYDMKKFASNVLRKDGLLYRLEILLPEIALPVRIHECRDFGGKEGSYETSMAGLTTRLEDGKGDNLEKGFPDSVPFIVRGQKMVAKIYAFKKGKAETYRTNEGIIVTNNGQTHGTLPKTFFERKSVKMDRLADSLLVIVDCSEVDVPTREDLFMPSRDRLSNAGLRNDLERQLEEIVGEHHALRQLRDSRKNEEIANRLEDSKPLEAILESLIKMSPTLSQLFLKGQRLSNPHKKQPPGNQGNAQGGGGAGPSSFAGKQHPTYFRFEKLQYGEMLERDCQSGRRCRLTLETDVENQYFSRASFPGSYTVEVLEGSLDASEINSTLTLHDGYAHWSIEIPEEAPVGESITIQCSVTDETLAEPFANVAKLRITPFVESKSHGQGNRKEKKGDDEQAGGEHQVGITMPPIVPVKEDEWPKHGFDKNTACKVTCDYETENGKEIAIHTFFINLDNIALRTEMKGSKEDPKLIEAKFKYGIVLVGLALLHQDAESQAHQKSSHDENADASVENVQNRIARTTHALAPFLVPMINYLGALTERDVAKMGSVGDDD